MCNCKLSRVDYERPAGTISDAVPLKVVNILTDTRTASLLTSSSSSSGGGGSSSSSSSSSSSNRSSCSSCPAG
jgi:hypothetical protein